MPKTDYTERVKIVPYDDGWAEYEGFFDFLYDQGSSMDTFVQNPLEEWRRISFFRLTC